MCSWVAESLLTAPELCCLGSDSLREAGGTAFGHRNTPPSSTTPCDQEPLFTWLSIYLALYLPGCLFTWLSDSALLFSRPYFVSYIIDSFLK